MQVAVYSPKQREIWSRLIDASANGTLFHRQEFLDYHPAGRFIWQHLVFGNPGEPTAVMPGAIHVDSRGNRSYRSPTGATLGGPVFRPRLGLAGTEELVAALAAYAEEAGFAAITLGTVPSIYWSAPDDTLEFALANAGFSSTPQLMYYVRLRPAVSSPATVSPDIAASSDITQLIPASKRADFRKALQQGLELKRAETADEVSAFYEVVRLNKAAHDATPVHSLEEIVRLKETLGDRLVILCAHKDGRVVAGVSCVAATPRVWYTQYIADRPDSRGVEATRFVLLGALKELIDRGAEMLDLGPSVQLPIQRRGGALFKESLGGIGCERREWTLVLPPMSTAAKSPG